MQTPQMDLQGYLAWMNQVHGLSAEAIAAFSSQLRERHYARGEVITLPGEVQHDLLLVLEGVHYSTHDEEGKQHVLAFAYPPSFSGIPASFFSGKPSTQSLISLTASRCLVISKNQLEGLMAEHRDLETLFRKLTEQVLAGVLVQNMELRAHSMEERFLAFARRSPHLLHLVPHKYLASYLGMDATNFSKLFNRIKI